MDTRAWKATKFQGVRYREHNSRKRGGKPDRYFVLRYQLKRKRCQEGLGWASEGWTAEKAALELADLKRRFRLGQDTVKSLRGRRDRAAAVEAQEEKAATTFKEFFETVYIPLISQSRDPIKEAGHFKNWLAPALGSKPIAKISSFDLERVKKALVEAGRTPRTVQYVMATCRQVWNTARRSGVVSGDSPTRAVSLARVDNSRERYLTPDEADRLLAALRVESEAVYRMALISLHSGLRFGEIAALKWQHVDQNGGRLFVMDTKSGRNRVAYMTRDMKAIFRAMTQEQEHRPDDLLFPDPHGQRVKQVPITFKRIVKALGLNEGITDPRRRMTFHTLRHTFASWHVQGGTDLYTLRALLGHRTMAMVARYSHLSPEGLQRATRAFEAAISKGLEKDVSELKK